MKATKNSGAGIFQLSILAVSAFMGAYTRTMISPLQESIRTGLGLSDNQMAIVQGPALALPLIVFSFPLGVLIDRTTRVRLIQALLVLDALGSFLTGWVSGFPLLCAARCLTGTAAFALNPVILSLVADRYAPAKRGRASTVILLGQLGGMAIAFALGGALLGISTAGGHTWRWACLWMACPVAGAVLLAGVAEEPRRAFGGIEKAPVFSSLHGLWECRWAIVAPLAGIVFAEMSIGAVLVWAAPTFARRFSLAPAQIGSIMATALMVSGVLGPVVGGPLADVAQARGGPRLTMLALTGMLLLGLPTGLFGLVGSATMASGMLVAFITILGAACVIGTTLFTIVTPDRVRGLALTILTAAVVMVGNGAAPFLVSEISRRMGGEAKIGNALSLVVEATIAMAALAFIAGRRLLSTRGGRLAARLALIERESYAEARSD